jgi:hypothetical protein
MIQYMCYLCGAHGALTIMAYGDGIAEAVDIPQPFLSDPLFNQCSDTARLGGIELHL